MILIRPTKLAQIMEIKYHLISYRIKKSIINVDKYSSNIYLSIDNAKCIAYALQHKSARPIGDIIHDLDNYKPY